jgi:hypothetical protein
MNPDANLLALEKGFWIRDARYYEEHLAADAAMVLPPPTGVLRRDRIVQSIEHAPRWRAVRMHGPVIARPSASMAVLTYRAEAWRLDGEPPYDAHVISIYRLSDDRWRLAFHQQTRQATDPLPRAAALRRARANATAVRAMAMGALATGAFAVGALAVGRLAIGAIRIGRARVGSLTIDQLHVRHLRRHDALEDVSAGRS